MKDSMETDEHALENQEPKDGICSLKPYESADTHSKSPDNRLDYSLHGNDQSMPHFPLETPVLESEDTWPIQCTEDYPQRDTVVHSYMEEYCLQRDAEMSSCQDQDCLQRGTEIYSCMDEDCLHRGSEVNFCKDEDCLQRDAEVNSCKDEDCLHRDAEVNSCKDEDCLHRDAEVNSCKDEDCLHRDAEVNSCKGKDCLQRDAEVNSCKDEDCLQRDAEVNSCKNQDCLHRDAEVSSCEDQDYFHIGSEVSSCKDEPEGPQQSQVNTCNQDDVDLPHSVSETPLSDHLYKKPRLKCVVRTENFADEKDLKLKCTTDESTTTKQFKSNPVETVEASPLDIKPFLKPLSRNQSVPVYMLRSFTPQVSRQSSKQYYDDELNRLATYIGYPSDIKIFAILLARDGFIFQQSEQSIQCWFCKLSISLSELRMPDANPVKMHGDRSPQCPLKQRESKDEPVPQRDETSRMLKSPSLGSHNVDSGITIGSHNADSGITFGSHSSDNGITFGSHSADSGTNIGSLNADSGINSGSMSSLTTDSPQEERSAPVLYHGDGATVLPSPVIQHPPMLNTSMDHITRTPQEQTPKNVDSNAQQSRQQPNLPQNALSTGVTGTAASLQRSDGATAQVSANTLSNGDSRNRPSSSASSSGQQAESPTGSEQAQASSSAASNSARNPKPTKKTKAARRAEARRASSTPGASASSTSAPAQTTAKKGEQNKENKDKKKLTYADLGIYAEKPKRPDMAALQKRLSTYDGKWQKSFAKTPQTLAECGMYYAGYNDCARCFFCGGGLKNWETGDEPWVEHARWFPKCAYLLLCKGQPFVDIVQRKNEKDEKIIMKDIEAEIRQKTQAAEMTTVSLPSSSGGAMADRTSLSAQNSNVKDLKELEKENDDLNAEMACKICMDERSSMVFLPCGHMVACTDCAVVLKNCPLCRAEIRGTVKAQMDF